MDQFKNLTSFLESFGLYQQINPYLLTNLVLVLVSVTVVALLKLLVTILEPTNYELDMTSGDYCKFIIEVDNNLRRNRKIQREFSSSQTQLSSNKRQNDSPLNCSMNELHSSLKFANESNNFLLSESCNTEANNVIEDDLRPLPSQTQQTKTNDSSSYDYLYVYPNGWIPLIESSKIKAGKIKRAIIFGKDVIVTRAVNTGEVSVLDAYCPHMGVHIGIGGRVKEVANQSCVECPFHGWTFRASDGQCVQIPYQKSCLKSNNIPKQAKLKRWISDEVDNFIYIWHHVDEHPPTWHLKPSVQLQAKNWVMIGRSCHTSNLDMRDMHENGADMNHFEGIHNDLFIFGGLITKLRPLNHLQKYFRHHYAPEWRPMVDDLGKMTHMAQMKLQSWISFFKLRMFDITVDAQQIGPARVNLYYDSEWYGKGILTMNSIPLGGRRTKYVQHIYTERTLFQCFMAKWVLYGEIKMLERDLFIWNHKKNIEKPIFIPEDRCLKQFRKWYSQFYSRKRISIRDSANENNSIQENIKPQINRINLDF